MSGLKLMVMGNAGTPQRFWYVAVIEGGSQGEKNCLRDGFVASINQPAQEELQEYLDKLKEK